ncbi:histidine kinase [Herbiconiux sp. UC225_62]|uniref:sensor histidine kinase n=1 Tax=Herbiconiux sp. UC225_62 TaxID=3350168 RepID=UPI0036D3D870
MPYPGRADDERGDESARSAHDERPRHQWPGPREWPGPRGRAAGHGAGWGPHRRWSGADDLDAEPRFRFSRWARLWLPVIISFVVQVPAALFTWRLRRLVTVGADEPWHLAARVGLALLGALALIAARRFPGPVVAVVSAAAGAYALLVAGEFAPPYIALAFAVVSAVVRGARVWAWWSLGVAWVLTVGTGILVSVDWQPAAVVAVTLGLVLLLGIGEGIRTRRARIDELRRRAAERRLTEVQAERVRIARELHDVLAHSLSQINVQAGVGLHLIDTQPELAASALANIKDASKSALDEVRSVLGVLRAGQDAPGAEEDAAPLVPEPDLSRLDGLVASVVSQGLQVTLENGIALGADAAPRTGPPPKAVQLALYRIVQESLTNVIRHAHATRATVTLAETTEAYTVSVVDDGSGAGSGAAARAEQTAGASRARGASPDAEPVRLGRGLLGMRERAELLGGDFSAGPRPDGGFVVAASIPRRPDLSPVSPSPSGASASPVAPTPSSAPASPLTPTPSSAPPSTDAPTTSSAPPSTDAPTTSSAPTPPSASTASSPPSEPTVPAAPSSPTPTTEPTPPAPPAAGATPTEEIP